MGYEVKDSMFQYFLKLVAISTTASFIYDPKIEEIKTYIARKNKQQASMYEKRDLTPD